LDIAWLIRTVVVAMKAVWAAVVSAVMVALESVVATEAVGREMDIGIRLAIWRLGSQGSA
jgi:hypothetical protein